MNPEIKSDPSIFKSKIEIFNPFKPVLRCLKFIGVRLYPIDLETPDRGGEVCLERYLDAEEVTYGYPDVRE